MPELRLASVPHCGTLFVQKLLGLDSHCHFPDAVIRTWVERGDLVVIPMRDPVSAYITTLNRSQNDPLAMLFNGMVEYARKPNVHLFRVDCPPNERHDELDRLASFAGWTYLPWTDWEPVNVTGGDPTGLRGAYVGSGAMSPALEKFAASLSQDVHDLYAERGYTMPWLRTAVDA